MWDIREREVLRVPPRMIVLAVIQFDHEKVGGCLPNAAFGTSFVST